ncbi:hypothetical protein [Actinokineospora spheciospongiae]|uniref:hypothetical protein n=1 Tax=Actinokineospora spheciospongiae TaxID=909613 RepID=UPI000D71BB9E|nr:hypothetical protein [Actinokineospora spheciospongiae]PWW64430.1 hypothetical protein DFQ13_103404 [Actinokineospora spheciospongiae]
MKFTQAEYRVLIDELRRLRRGPGLAAQRRIALDALSAVPLEAVDTADAVQGSLIAAIHTAAEQLAPEFATAALTALGLHPQYADEQLGERIQLLARATSHSERTIQRRIDDAFSQLANALMSRTVTTGSDHANREEKWENAHIKVNVVYGGQNVVDVFETREVVALDDGLALLHLGITAPARADRSSTAIEELEIHAIQGGTIVEKQAETNARVGFWLKLPQPLAAGERHEYTIHVRVSENSMKPYYICELRRRCASFKLNVKFHTPPAEVQLLSEEFQADVSDETIKFPSVPINSAGEVNAEFTSLSPGLVYGLRWVDSPLSGHSAPR